MNVKQSLYKITRISSILVSLFILLLTTTAVAASVTLCWDPNDPAPEGYRVFARRSDQTYNYSRPDWEGAAVTSTINNLEDQTEYYFVVRACDGSLESTDSNEVHYIPPAPTNPAPNPTPPSWDGATTGVGLATDTATGGSVTVEFDTASNVAGGTNLKFNVYYAANGSWNNADWMSNSVIADAAVGAGSTFAHAVTVSGLTDGVSYTFGVRVEDQSGNEEANTSTLNATPTYDLSDPFDVATTGNGIPIIRVNTGGGVYTDASGNLWSADSGYNTGSTYSTANAISDTADDALYQSERYDRATSPELEYRLDVANGTYTVRLYFAEIFSGAAGVGLRVFDVDIEDQLVFNDLDIFSEAGLNAALIKSAAVTVSDGQLNILFQNEIQNPKVSAIEVISQADDEPPTIPPGLSGTAAGSTQIDLSWNPSTDTGGSGLAGYQIYRDGVMVGTSTLEAFSDSGLAPGTIYSYEVLAYDNALNESALSDSFVVATADDGIPIIRVNAGGGAYTDGSGNLWSADSGYNTGSTYSTANAISGTVDDALYQSERYDRATSPELEYRLDVANGTYTVRLYFAEIFSGAAGVGLRVFDVDIEGQLVFDDLDVFSEAGLDAALIKSATVTVSDGQLNILFQNEIQNPKISAIEVISQAAR